MAADARPGSARRFCFRTDLRVARRPWVTPTRRSLRKPHASSTGPRSRGSKRCRFARPSGAAGGAGSHRRAGLDDDRDVRPDSRRALPACVRRARDDVHIENQAPPTRSTARFCHIWSRPERARPGSQPRPKASTASGKARVHRPWTTWKTRKPAATPHAKRAGVIFFEKGLFVSALHWSRLVLPVFSGGGGGGGGNSPPDAQRVSGRPRLPPGGRRFTHRLHAAL